MGHEGRLEPGVVTSHNWAKHSSMRPSRSTVCWTAVEAEMSGLNTPPRRMSGPNAETKTHGQEVVRRVNSSKPTHNSITPGKARKPLGAPTRIPRAGTVDLTSPAGYSPSP